jgi:hypothetical protein
MIISEIEGSESHAMFLGCTEAVSCQHWKSCYITGMLSRLGQATASVDCGGSGKGEEWLNCKARGLKIMLNSSHCCVAFHVEWFNLISYHHHLHFTSLSSAFNYCVIWCDITLTIYVIICRYSLYIHKSLPMSRHLKQVNALPHAV